MGLDERTALSLIDSLYESAAGDDWVPFLAELREQLGAVSTVLLRHEREPLDIDFLGDSGCDAGYLRSFRERWAKNNELIEAGQKKGLLGPGRPTCSLEALSGRAWESTEVFNHWYRPQDYYCMWGVSVELDAGRIATLSVQYAGKETPRERAPQLLLEQLRGHLTGAARIHDRLAKAEATRETLLEATGRMGCEICLLDARGRVLVMSAGAEEIFAADDGLSLSAAGELRAASAADQATLVKMIGQHATLSSQTLASRGAMALSRPSGKTPYQLLIVPPRRLDVVRAQPTAILYISDPDSAAEPHVDVLQMLYGLSAAEARVATLLVGGHPISEIAPILRVSRETVRSQAKQVYAKTDTSGQPALVQRLLTNVTGLC